MQNRILSIIDDKYRDFSKAYKTISDYIKYNYAEVSFLSIKELSSKIGVSTASISRYTQDLGFSGYQEFQKEMQGIVKTEIEPSTEVKNSILLEYNEENILKDMIKLNIKNLEDTYSDELYIAFNKALDMIEYDKKIYIVGLRSSFPVAYHLYYILSRYMSDVELIDVSNDYVYDRLAFIKKEDILISISFSKYAKSTLRIAEFFKKSGNRIIAVTDSVFSPEAIISDVSLIVQNRHTTFSFVSVMTVLNAFAVALGKRHKDKSLERIKQREKILAENDIYVLKS